MQGIYLDYNATTPIDREVADAMQPVMREIFGNPSSAHSFGFDARRTVEEARGKTAALLDCMPEEIIFTSGGTESNNHAIKGIAKAYGDRGRHIITSAIEHPATLEACRFLEREGYEVSYIPVDRKGMIRLEELRASIRQDTILISVMHANNEIGTIQPIQEISRIARKHEIPFHTDAAQTAGKISVSVRELGVDLLSLAGHKFYGPKGIGALFCRSGILLEKLIHGADHEMNRRAGTENVMLIAGFGKACEVAKRDLEKNHAAMKKATEELYRLLYAGISGLVRNGDPVHCLPNTLNLAFPGMEADLFLAGLPDIAASAGAACHSEHAEISHVLKAIGLEPELANGSIRLSTGKMTTMKEIREAAGQMIETARTMMPHEEKSEAGPGLPGEVKLTRFTHGLGCACKLRPQDLETILNKIPHPSDQAILVDSRHSDDATVWKISQELAWVQSVDFFTPVVDDPFHFGAIAAANALSDLYAMGATPLFALNIVAFPVQRLSLDVLHRILEGAQATALKAGMHILGGHSIEDPELKYGMVVNGKIHPEHVYQNSGARPGDRLILTKPIGTGILSTAMKRGRLNKENEDLLIRSMSELNRIPADLFPDFKVHAVTDVTGFGLLGHLLEMLQAGEVSAKVDRTSVPLLRGVKEALMAGMVPGGTKQNLEYVQPHIHWHETLSQQDKLLLADAQTSGGLLISIQADQAEDYLLRLESSGCTDAVIIGEITSREQKYIRVR
jgi:selenium donor protein